MLRSIFITIMLTAVLMLSAVTQEVLVKEKNITMEFENIHLKDVEFIDGDKIKIEHAKKDDVRL